MMHPAIAAQAKCIRGSCMGGSGSQCVMAPIVIQRLARRHGSNAAGCHPTKDGKAAVAHHASTAALPRCRHDGQLRPGEFRVLRSLLRRAPHLRRRLLSDASGADDTTAGQPRCHRIRARAEEMGIVACTRRWQDPPAVQWTAGDMSDLLLREEAPAPLRCHSPTPRLRLHHISRRMTAARGSRKCPLPLKKVPPRFQSR
jgi:hypothetical protein